MVTAENIEQLKKEASKLKIDALLAIWNEYEKPIKKFENKEKAVFNVKALYDRLLEDPTYKHVEAGKPVEEAPAPKGRKKQSEEEKAAKAIEKEKQKADLKAEQEAERAAKKAAKEAEREARKAAKANPAFRFEPNPDKAPHAVKIGSMVSQIIDLIARPQGATLEELEAVSYNTSHSVKSLLNYDMRNQVGYGYYSEDGITVHIIYPEGMTEPLPHVEKAPPKPPKEKKVKVPKGTGTPAVVE